MTKCDRIKICGYWENSKEVPTSLPYSWFATTWQSGHVWSQNNRIKYRLIYMKIELSSQEGRKMRLFLTSNMAAVTSRANFRIQGRRRQQKHRWKSEFAFIQSSSHRSNSLTLSNVGELQLNSQKFQFQKENVWSENQLQQTRRLSFVVLTIARKMYRAKSQL